MSVAHMTDVFRHSGLPTAKKAVLLALADSAAADGKCWPGVDHLAIYASLSRSRTMVILSDLCATDDEGRSFLIRVRAGHRGQRAVYQIRPVAEWPPPDGPVWTDETAGQDTARKPTASERLSGKPTAGDSQTQAMPTASERQTAESLLPAKGLTKETLSHARVREAEPPAAGDRAASPPAPAPDVEAIVNAWQVGFDASHDAQPPPISLRKVREQARQLAGSYTVEVLTVAAAKAAAADLPWIDRFLPASTRVTDPSGPPASAPPRERRTYGASLDPTPTPTAAPASQWCTQHAGQLATNCGGCRADAMADDDRSTARTFVDLRRRRD